MDWSQIYFGHVSVDEVKKYTPDPDWQIVRRSMKGTSLQNKYNTLKNWLFVNDSNRMSQVQVTNYVTALSRGGLITPKDYRR